MTITRRHMLATAAASTITVLPFRVFAGGHLPNEFKTDGGVILIHPVSHASFVMETPAGTIYVDPVGDAAQYEAFPAADLILITHEHGDHYNADTLAALKGDATHVIANPAVAGMIGDADHVEAIANGESTEWNGVGIEALGAYNITEERLNFHPKGRDNGYVLTIDGHRTYISADTEDHEEMRALRDIDLAFVCMNLPFTMDAAAAASAVSEIKPSFVYPYHYRGRDGGTQDPAEFAALIEGDGVEVKMGDWYAPGEI